MSATVNAVFYTEAHRITGSVYLRERLNETLNDPLTDYLELTNVLVSKLVDPTHRQVQWPTSAVPKSAITLVTLDQAEHESSATRADKVTKKSGTQIGCVASSIEVYGTAHLNFEANARTILSQQLRSFFPVTDATLLMPTVEDTRLETGLVFVNRDMVRAFSLL